MELTVLRDGPADAPGGLHLLVRDLRERKATARFEHLALHDQLTGLPNRRALLDRLEDALRTSPGRRARLAVLLFDIDKFKYINDTLGHAAGDAVLSHVAAQMMGVVRPTDTLARFGGDEFVLLARGIDSVASAEALAKRFRTQASRALCLNGRDVSVDLSVGYALVDQASDSPERILERADRAMYASKERSRLSGLAGKRLGQTKTLFGNG